MELNNFRPACIRLLCISQLRVSLAKDELSAWYDCAPFRSIVVLKEEFWQQSPVSNQLLVIRVP